MLMQIIEKQEEIQARKEYKENKRMISDLDDIYITLDEAIEQIRDVKPEFENKFIQNLRDIQFDIIGEKIAYEDRNLDIMEIWEEEMEEW